MKLVVTPTTTEQLDQVRDLMRAFIEWHRQRHLQDIALIDEYFDAVAFDKELASLPGKYAQPQGGLFLATHDGSSAGCVALREIDTYCCEMKRMFVYPHLHGKGVGRALAEAAIKQARVIGYKSMLLDTSIRQDEAKALYQRLGFNVIQPYYELPERLRNWLVFMELRL
jgi:GNAT superfamily N-acetyltransferase